MTLSLDGGQACIYGAFAHLPAGLPTKSKGKEPVKNNLPMEGVIATNRQSTVRVAVQDPILPTSAQESTMSAPGISPRPVFYNVAVKSKAVYQPNFRFRRWLENEKNVIPDGEEESVLGIEARLPPLRGQEASVVNYIKDLESVETRLLQFYSGGDNRYDRHVWDMERARHVEFQMMADQLLKIVGGGIGVRYDPSKPALIGIGLGQFLTRSGLSSLHSSFLSYFIQKARSLGYLVVGLNEFYTSKKCPGCGLFVCQVDMRRFYCPNCRVYHHRDVMAAENMANITQGYLAHQERPDYLHPVAKDGSLPWKAKRDDGSRSSSTSSGTTSTATTSGNTSSTASNSAANSANPTKGRRKRTATTSNVDEQRPEKASRN
ncbi:hypothetical protein BGZ97_001957 [Linnemannia gamsii]|uniref:Cas12f1-like TNB domain-containing protein n=1 Tax=Linnemannia gamsii TaxID=64522 RepID=A0A9P6UIW4_9FUNG|nr:hypothetical protein BGZ97_001957 [Linnemannia gamsii]